MSGGRTSTSLLSTSALLAHERDGAALGGEPRIVACRTRSVRRPRRGSGRRARRGGGDGARSRRCPSAASARTSRSNCDRTSVARPVMSSRSATQRVSPRTWTAIPAWRAMWIRTSASTVRSCHSSVPCIRMPDPAVLHHAIRLRGSRLEVVDRIDPCAPPRLAAVRRPAQRDARPDPTSPGGRGRPPPATWPSPPPAGPNSIPTSTIGCPPTSGTRHSSSASDPGCSCTTGPRRGAISSVPVAWWTTSPTSIGCRVRRIRGRRGQ